MSDADTFEYEIEVPATVVKLRLSKQAFYTRIEKDVKKHLTSEDKKIAWDAFSSHGDFLEMFPREAARQGCLMYTVDDGINYCEIFQESVENAIQKALDTRLAEVWGTSYPMVHMFERAIDHVSSLLGKRE